MSIEVDHVFIVCSDGAPEAEALSRLGLREGSRNTHPGQGTANRRFFFHDFFLELLWVSTPDEARSESVRRTRLWDRWSTRTAAVCPFGIVLRPRGVQSRAAPFKTWSYRPSYMPAGMAIEVAEGTSLQEPELFYFPSLQRSGPPPNEPTDHLLPVGRIDGIAVGVPAGTVLSEAAAIAASEGALRYFFAEQYLLEITFRAEREAVFDLRPELPLVIRALA